VKRYFVAILISVLFLITFSTLPNVDYTEPNVLFYLERLPVLYHISLLASMVAAIYFGKSSLGIFCAVISSLLLLWTPSMMLVNPWILDSYPFVAEAVYVARNGHLGPFHVNLLQETPALGLAFGPYLLITDISPFVLLKIFPGLVAAIFTILLYFIARKMNLGRKISVIAPLLFTSILWPNLLHFCRQGFSLVYYLAAWFLLLRLVLGKPDRRIFVLLISQVFLLTLSHPGSSFFFLTNLVAVAVVGRILGKIRQENLRLITHTSLISALTWLVWNVNCVPGSKTVRVWVDIGERLVQSLLQDPTEVSGAAKIFTGYTSIYGFIIDVRFALTLLICASIVLLPFAVYRYARDRTLLLLVYALWSPRTRGWAYGRSLSSGSRP